MQGESGIFRLQCRGQSIRKMEENPFFKEPNYLKSSVERMLSHDMEEVKKRTGAGNYGNWAWKS